MIGKYSQSASGSLSRSYCNSPYTRGDLKLVIVKGLDMRPYSSLVTTASSNSSVEYIQWLENEIIEVKETRARDQEERAKDQDA